MFLKVIAIVAIIAAFAGFIWASDRITVQGERTVYTVSCDQGVWQGNRCTGRLVAGNRYTFRASRSRQEVLYWIFGSNSPSGKYTECLVQNRGNWTCKASPDQPLTITQEMKNDRPTPGADNAGLPFHAVPKWKWWALHYGIAHFTDADG